MNASESRRVVLSYPVLRNREGASSQALARAEGRWGVPLRGAIREWLLFCNGVVIGPEALYGLEQDDPDIDIDYRQSLWLGWAELGWIPVGGDGCGNSYVIDLTGATSDPPQSVYFIEAMEPLEPAYVIASNVWTFVEKYVRRDEPDSPGWEVCDRPSAMTTDPALAAIRTDVPMPWEAD